MMAWRILPKGGNKYHNRIVMYKGMRFDSQRELDRYIELELMQRAGMISDLRRQVEYELIPKQKVTVGSKTVTERAVKYMADFVYVENGETVVEDVKGFKTDVYKIKRKLLTWRYGVVIKET